MIAYARAAYRLHQKGETGARTVFDIPLGMLTPDTMEKLREKVL
jgi:diaminopimelate dehydrogenase